MKQAEFKAQLLRKYGKHPRVRIWPMNRGKAFRGRRMIEFGVPGQADFSGIIAGGLRLEIEHKSDHDQQSQDQKNFEATIRRFGGVYILARGIEDVDRVLLPLLEHASIIDASGRKPRAGAGELP